MKASGSGCISMALVLLVSLTWAVIILANLHLSGTPWSSPKENYGKQRSDKGKLKRLRVVQEKRPNMPHVRQRNSDKGDVMPDLLLSGLPRLPARQLNGYVNRGKMPSELSEALVRKERFVLVRLGVRGPQRK
ncbi:hypothetical protein F5141DRAFT_465448 [Pisolithus sp. B1]|nr:hypothetical protein F5141DRAFT_465448 [Pisolithus sp. B1]